MRVNSPLGQDSASSKIRVKSLNDTVESTFWHSSASGDVVRSAKIHTGGWLKLHSRNDR